ncbi:MAG: cell division protein ZapE [Burkholderiales bacterium]|nr:cell division protein ZapE [Burkholderiales bacterium]
MNVQEFYLDALAKRGYSADEAQMQAIARLQRGYEEWVAYKARRGNRFTRMIIKPEIPRGVYLWGGVGRGKSFLMDSFYSVCPLERKTRLHFHEFMRGVHRQLDEIKGIDNLDEFHVSDVADAMIMYNLLSALFERRVSFIMTSNYAPDTLYPDGLHRDRMLPTIALLKEKLDVLNVDAGIDYRKRALLQVQSYYTPLNASAEQALNDAFNRIAETADEEPQVMIEQRALKAKRRAGTIIWFDFDTLCRGPRSQNDYLEIASRYHTVILSDIPEMSAAMASEARRFTWLIDVFYDCKVKLLMSAAVAPELLYTVGNMANEFQRTVSRIVEMQSQEYMDAEQRLVAAKIT